MRFDVLLALVLSFLLFSCNSPKNTSGTFHSKFAVHGLFGTTIRLKADKKLEYVFQGDLMYDSATGQYQLYNNKIYVLFDKELKDSNKLYYRFDNMPVKTISYLGSTIQYQEFFYIGCNKLFPANIETGRKVTSARGYSKRKKYIIFGSHYYSKRYYYRHVTER